MTIQNTCPCCKEYHDSSGCPRKQITTLQCVCYPPNSYAISVDRNGNCAKCGNVIPWVLKELKDWFSNCDCPSHSNH